MSIDAESFRGKLCLLMIDKLVIGAIIASSFAAYDWWKDAENQKRADEAAEIQLEFEQAKLIKEFLPIIVDKSQDPATRGYVLRSALVTEAIDAETGVELARALIPAGLDDHQFRRVLAAAMPAGIPALCRHSVSMAELWRETAATEFRPTATFDPLSGNENIPEELALAVHEARLWRSVVVDAIPRLEESPELLSTNKELAPHLYGLFLLLQPGSQLESQELSVSSSRAVRLVGNISRTLFDSSDTEAVNAVEAELALETSSPDEALASIRLASIILSILQEFGPPHAGVIAKPIASVLVSPLPYTHSRVQVAHYWLRWQAADLLEAMNNRMATFADRIGWRGLVPLSGARAAESILIESLTEFQVLLGNAGSEAELEELATVSESGKLIRRVVSILGGLRSEEAREALRGLYSVGSEKLRHFPFLEEEIERALSLDAENGA